MHARSEPGYGSYRIHGSNPVTGSIMDKELFTLHELYNKHAWHEVGKAGWEGKKEPIYMCTCGLFSFLENQKRYQYTKNTHPTWLINTFRCLDAEHKALFAAYLRPKRGMNIAPKDHLEIFGPKKPRNKAAAKPINMPAGARPAPGNGDTGGTNAS